MLHSNEFSPVLTAGFPFEQAQIDELIPLIKHNPWSPHVIPLHGLGTTSTNVKWLTCYFLI